MERGRFFYHDLDESDEFQLEPDGTGYDNEPVFKLSIVCAEERIEIRNLVLSDLKYLRDKLNSRIAVSGDGDKTAADPERS